MEKKVEVINKLYKKEVTYKAATKLVNKKIKRSSLDKKVIKNLKEYLESYEKGYEYSYKKEHSNILKFEKDLKEEVSLKKNKFNEIVDLLEENKKDVLSVSKKKYSKSDKKLNELMKNIDKKELNKYIKDLDSSIIEIKKDIKLLEYLEQNIDNIKLNNKVIEFQKRSTFEEFEKLEKSKEIKENSYTLIKDVEGPVISGDSFSIYVDRKIDLPSRFHCEDRVDDVVECKIEGNYDSSKVGEYKIKISAKDKTGNESSKTITVKVLPKPINKNPYKIDVIRNHNVVVVYGLDDNYEYTKIVKIFVASTGGATPTGTFKISNKYTWRFLYGGVWGQYATRIVGDILFHSVPYYSKSKSSLKWIEYNKLGTQASMGCVRLAVRDAKWIYNNCSSGTTVNIYNGSLPPGVYKPAAIKIDGNNPNRGWDPTDDDPNNPW